jgi:hypothetical protein
MASTVAGGARQQPAAGRPPVAYAPAQPPAYAPEEEEYPPDRSRWIVIGCGVLTLLFCCLLVAAVIIIDQTNSYCSLPFANQFFYCP